MAELFIAWNQNYNKLIDFIDYQIGRVRNPRLTIHVFVARNIAVKDSPRDLNYVMRHKCLTDAEDSAEAQLIAYVLRNHASKQTQESTENSPRKSLLFVQTRPGQHEELLMLLTNVPGFTSEFIARIYKIDEEFESEIIYEVPKRQHGFTKGTVYHSTRRNDLKNGSSYKGLHPNSSTANEWQDEKNYWSSTRPDSYRDADYERETDHFRKKADPYSNGSGNAQRETNTFRPESPIRLYSNIDHRRMNHRQDEVRKDRNGISNSYEKHRVCEECVNDILQSDSFNVPVTRRTWPSSQSGRRKHEERITCCELCKQRFRSFHVSDEKTDARFGAQNSFESTFDDFDNLEMKSNDNKEIHGHEQYSPWQANYSLWGNTKNSRCNCSETHICTNCFVRKLEGSTTNMKEKNSPEENQSFIIGESLRERPGTSPAALQGSWEGKKSPREKNKTEESENKRNHDENFEAKAKIKDAGQKGHDVYLTQTVDRTSLSEARGSWDKTPEDTGMVAGMDPVDTGMVAGMDPVDTGMVAGIDPVDNTILQGGVLKDAEESTKEKEEISPVAEGNRLQNDGDFQHNLEKLLARLEVRAPEEILEREHVDDGDLIAKEWRHDIGLENKKGTPYLSKNNAKIQQNSKDIDNELDHSTPSRITSYNYDYGSREAQDSPLDITNAKEKRRKTLAHNNNNNNNNDNDNDFEYDIFGELDKKLGIGKAGKAKRKRDKMTLNRGSLINQNGKYTCQFCPAKTFASVHVWRIHMKNSHKKCNCPCDKYFETREDYLSHFYSLFPLACFLERKCPERFRSLYFQAVHHREKHFSDRPFFCVQCFIADEDSTSKRRACFKDIKSLRIHAESMGHDPNDMFLISSQSDADNETLPWSMKCTGIDFC